MTASLAALLLLLAPPAAQEELTFTFAWPASGSVRVDERTIVQGQEGEITYLLHWGPHGDTGDILVEYSELELVRAGGIPASDPQLAEELVNFSKMRFPGMRVAADGRLVGIEGVAEARRSTLEYMRAKGMKPAELEAYAKIIEQPDFELRFQAKNGDTWQSWVGALANQPVVLGTDEEFDVELPFQGRQGGISARRKVRCDAVDSKGGPRRVALRSSTTFAGPELRTLIEAFRGPGSLNGVEPLSRVDAVEGIYEVATLRPLRVRRSSTLRLKAGGNERVEVEEHTYVFHWADLVRAEGQ